MSNGTGRAAAECARLRWRSRRGLLELELVLRPFVDHRLAALSAPERVCYARLLEHDDLDILDWVQGRGEPPDAALGTIVAAIRDARGGA